MDENGKLVSDGALAVYKKNILLPADGDSSSFYAILDRTTWKSVDDTLVLNVPIQMFITGDLAFYATMVEEEGMDKSHWHWCN
jgi:hypothetical protein